MPGSYAHITLVNELSKTQQLEKTLALPESDSKAILRYSKFCEMGSISPDYPYLNLGKGRMNAYRWSDLMHHKHKKLGIEPEGNILHAGIELLRKIEGEEQLKCFAWFAGYASHIGADVTIHPVVNLKVGNYDEGNQTAHRNCEMHQDAYIYKTRYGLDIGISEHISAIIGSCTNPAEKDLVDWEIGRLWNMILRKTYPNEHRGNAPAINLWHKAVQFYLDDIAEEGNRLFPFARHVGVRFGLIYPDFTEVDSNYIDNLFTPRDITMSYDEIFDLAVDSVGKVWKTIADAVFQESEEYKERIGIWDLDSGIDASGNMVFWS